MKTYNIWDKIQEVIKLVESSSGKTIIGNINSDHMTLPMEDTPMVASGPENRGLKG